MTTESVDKGCVLLRRGQPLHEVLHIASGRVVMGVGLGEGGRLGHVLDVRHGPFWLEAAAAVLALPSSVDAVADSALTLRRLAPQVFAAQWQDLPALPSSLMLDMAHGQRQQTERAISLLMLDADARCAQWLLSHAEPPPAPTANAPESAGPLLVHLRERKRAIAAQLGIAPETLSRALRHLRERKLISGAGSHLRLIDPAGLRQLAGV